jgi:sulfatase modifying factor 1
MVIAVLVVASASIGMEACSSSDSDAAPATGDGGMPVDPDGATTDPDAARADGATGPDGGQDANSPESGPGASCGTLGATCGGAKDCCASNVVPGGTFNRSDDGAFPATVSDFKLDVFEVTVGRFRTFVNSGKGTQANPPAPGDGAHPKVASSGWDAAFNANLATDTAALKAELKCIAAYPAWSDAPGANETRPINCVTWYEAFAFCAWDGGRLPTETEWNYAAAGGSEQRAYPWGAGIDLNKASYACGADGLCTFSDMLPVGSKSPQGDGKWGQADLAGNVWEWTLDWSRTPYRLTTCVDCADVMTSPNKTFRGGGFPNESFYLTTATRLEDTPLDRDYDVGFRCARAAP